MSEINLFSEEYKTWITDLKNKIRSTQIKAATVVNKVLIEFYWEIGKMISEKQTAYGTAFLDQVSKDLKTEFPALSGFSLTNLRYCRSFYNLLSIPPQLGGESNISNHPQLGGVLPDSLIFTLPWGHIKVLIDKIKDKEALDFYVKKTLSNNWSRDILALQIKTDLYNRQGKAITNFANTLPDPFSDLAQQTLKDPYVFDFMTMSKPFHEKDIERQLISHITKFLLELGKGFSFVGQQYHLEIANNDYYIDMLFYHIKLKCYVVIELKNTKFIPEYAGKLNFYLSAVDSLLKQSDDKNTIGILLCRDKNNIEAEFALRDINKPMGISEFQFTEVLPDELKSSLPTIEEIENELKNLDGE